MPQTKRVLLDACGPRWLGQQLGDFDVEDAHAVGLDQIPDGRLLKEIAGRFDVLVTMDRNLQYQQKLAGRAFAVVIIRVRDQSPPSFMALVPVLVAAITQSKPGTVTEVEG